MPVSPCKVPNKSPAKVGKRFTMAAKTDAGRPFVGRPRKEARRIHGFAFQKHCPHISHVTFHTPRNMVIIRSRADDALQQRSCSQVRQKDCSVLLINLANVAGFPQPCPSTGRPRPELPVWTKLHILLSLAPWIRYISSSYDRWRAEERSRASTIHRETALVSLALIARDRPSLDLVRWTAYHGTAHRVPDFFGYHASGQPSPPAYRSGMTREMYRICEYGDANHRRHDSVLPECCRAFRSSDAKTCILKSIPG